MSDQYRTGQIEELLQLAARSLSYPPTPDIAGAVRDRLARERRVLPASAPTVRFRPRLAWVALAVLVALLLSLSVPEVQAFVRSILRIGSIEIVVATPTPAGTDGQPTIAGPAWDRGLVGETSLSAAQGMVPFRINLPRYPADLGMPQRVFAQDLDGPAVILAWLDPGRPDKVKLVLNQLSSSIMGRKTLDDTTMLAETLVNGRPAAWVSGPHMLEIYSSNGRRNFQPRRLVEGNVLIWEDSGITYRLKSTLALEEAVLIAKSVQPIDPTTLALTPVPTDVPTSATDLVGETTLAETEHREGHAILTPAYPSDLGPPDKVYGQYRAGTVIILVWLEPGSWDRARLILYQLDSNTHAEKIAPETTVVQQTEVNGRPAAWLVGPHVLEFRDRQGHIDRKSRRLIEGNVLVWEQNGFTYRLESALPLEEAVRVAELLR